MKQYFFGYLFVRIAKILAIIMVLIGVAYVLFQFEHAKIAADSARYLSNSTLRDLVGKLFARSSEAQRLVSEFTGEPKLKSEANADRFSSEVTSMSDFQRLAELLDVIGRERQIPKQSVIVRFEGLVEEIQKKLRTYAESLSPPKTMPPAMPPAAPRVKVTPAPKPTPTERETLFSNRLSDADIQTRLSHLDADAQFLKVLATTAENSQNRATLSESIRRLDDLKTLVPSRPTAPIEVPPQEEPQQGVAQWQTPVPSSRKVLNAEKVADQLEQLRASVRQAILSSWALDDTFDAIQQLAESERIKCRSATLAVQRIWLTAFGVMAGGAIAMAFVAFLVLVMADLTQTLLDTATNTGLIAERRSEQR